MYNPIKRNKTAWIYKLSNI